METPPPDGLDEGELAAALSSSWGLGVGGLRYVPKGYGSYHWTAATPDGRKFFLAVDDLDVKPWLGDDCSSTFEGLRAAYGTASRLREQAGLGFVVGPVPAYGGDAAVRLSSRYSLAVFPFVPGEAGRWGEPLRPGDRDGLIELLAALHAATPSVASLAPRRGVHLPGRSGLEEALDALGRPWTGGPLAEPARRELADGADTVHEWLTSFDQLGVRVAEAGAAPVVTHGEPHPGNLMRTADGTALIDWDTVAIAPPERDLWMLDDGTGAGLARYGDLTGRAVDDNAVALYRLGWRLLDVALFTAQLRSAHGRDQGTKKALWGLTVTLRSTAEPPYRLVS
jgi:spectinomycin phosphotransferase